MQITTPRNRLRTPPIDCRCFAVRRKLEVRYASWEEVDGSGSLNWESGSEVVRGVNVMASFGYSIIRNMGRTLPKR